MHELKFAVILYGLAWLLRATAWRSPVFRARLKELNFTAQLKTYDDSLGRWYEFRNGKVRTGSGIRTDAEEGLTMHLATYIGLVDGGERMLAESFRQVAEGHGEEPDVAILCGRFAVQCDSHRAQLGPVVERYGEKREREPERRAEVEERGDDREQRLRFFSPRQTRPRRCQESHDFDKERLRLAGDHTDTGRAREKYGAEGKGHVFPVGPHPRPHRQRQDHGRGKQRDIQQVENQNPGMTQRQESAIED